MRAFLGLTCMKEPSILSANSQSFYQLLATSSYMLFSRIMLFPSIILFVVSSCVATSTFPLHSYSLKETWVTAALSFFTVGLVLTICWALINLPSFYVIIRERLSFENLLKQRGYSKKAVKELWKWYDSSEKKGAASF